MRKDNSDDDNAEPNAMTRGTKRAQTSEPSRPPKTAKALQPVSHKKPLDPELNADACEKISEWSPIINPPPYS